MGTIKAGQAKETMSKYKATPTIIDGITFHSKREAKRYAFLKLLEAAKEILHLTLQPTYQITLNDKPICKVKLDFKYFDKKLDAWVIEDSKGYDNPVSKLKRKLVEAGHNIKVTIV
jgi:hypothetical protein